MSCWPYSCDCQTADANNPQAKCTQVTKECPRVYVAKGSVRAAVVLKPQKDTANSVDDVDVPATQQLIKQFIYDHGPMVTGFNVCPEFMHIPSDSNYVFQSTDTSSQGWHAVAIVGWGRND